MILKFILFINFLLVFVVLAYEINNKTQLVRWSMITLFLPIVGFLIYFVFGNGLKMKSAKRLKYYSFTTKHYLSQTNWFNEKTKNNLAETKIYINGKDFLNDLLKQIAKAKLFIFLEFYILASDKTGKKLFDLLAKKAQTGVKIKIIYDGVGSKKTSNKIWTCLKNYGVDVMPFFPPIINNTYINTQINYRNHRKIAIIDGKIGFVGGINIRSDHMGYEKKLKPWRDTALKINGAATHDLTTTFLNDWQFVTKAKISKNDINYFFPQIESQKGIVLHTINSNPIDKNKKILNFYINQIKNAKKYIIVQTPYFIVDNQIINLLLDADKRGVKIAIFIPKLADKKLVYANTLMCLKSLVNSNVSIYLYKGFLHSKVFITENVVSIGSCNFDNRSFKLNFETNCYSKNKNFIEKNLKIIKNDIENSTLLTNKLYKKIKTKNVFYIAMHKLFVKFL
ncbi:MAG: cardiolipin synthase [Clostridiales bacterium]|nr:cardiolipin synthase [Clostridiales bacterium]